MSKARCGGWKAQRPAGKAGCEAEETSETSACFQKDETGPRGKAGWQRWCLWLASRKESVWTKLRNEERLTKCGLQAEGRLEPEKQRAEGQAPCAFSPQELQGMRREESQASRWQRRQQECGDARPAA